MKSNLSRFDKGRYLSIRWKLVIPLAFVILLLVIISPIVSGLITGRIEQEADRRLGESANSVQGLFENSQYLATSGAALVATQPEIVKAFNPNAPYKTAVIKLKESLRLQELSLYATNFKRGDSALFYGGPQVIRRLQVSEETIKTREDLLFTALKDGAPASSIVIAPQGSQILGVAPVYADDGKTIVGAVLASFYIDDAFVRNISNIIGADIAIVKDNKVVVSSLSEDANYEHLVLDGSLAKMGSISETITYKNGQQDRLLAKPLLVSDKNQGYVLVAQPIAELLAVSESIQSILVVFSLVFALTTLWFWISALLTFTRPLSLLTEAITRILDGDLNQRVDTRYVMFKDEITVLSEHFNRMTTDLHDVYSSLEERVRLRTEELAEARDNAIAANKSKTEFVSIVSHELKVPMTSIKGYSELILAGAAGPVTEPQANFLKVIRSNVSRMAVLVSDLADISRLESGHLNLEPTMTDTKNIIEDVARLSKSQIDQKQQTLQIETPDELPMVWYDKNRLSQVMTNLVSNANKYTQDGGTITVRVSRVMHTCSEHAAKDVIQVKVQDNGYGMTPDDQQKLFSKFFRSPDDKVREAPGTGLGLSITKNLIELQGGCIWFESEYRKGTAFYFTIPVMGKPEA